MAYIVMARHLFLSKQATRISSAIVLVNYVNCLLMAVPI